MKNHPRFNRKRASGFGLVEIMVAMLIGMFGVLIMMQVLTVSEEQKRTTTSGNDSMNEGVLALYSIQTDVRMGGYGIADAKILGCRITLRAGLTLDSLSPVTILPAGNPFPAYFPAPDANTDGLLAFYSSNYGSPQGVAVIGAGNLVQTPSSFAAGDWVVVAPAVRVTPCNLVLNRVTGVNLATGVITLASAPVPAIGDTVFNLGQNYRAVGYAVRGSNLATCDFTIADCAIPASWTALSGNIVSLRAQYGQDATVPNMDGFVDAYNQDTPNPAVTPNTLCGWSRIQSLRLALVSRSVQIGSLDRSTGLTEVLTPAPPLWDGGIANNPAGSTAASIVLTGDPNWQNYRYKVFQTVVPIRNMAWMGVVTGC